MVYYAFLDQVRLDEDEVELKLSLDWLLGWSEPIQSCVG